MAEKTRGAMATQGGRRVERKRNLIDWQCDGLLSSVAPFSRLAPPLLYR